MKEFGLLLHGTWQDGRRKFELTENNPGKALNVQKTKPKSNKQVQEERLKFMLI